MDKRKFNKGTKGNKGGRPPKSIYNELLTKLAPSPSIACKTFGWINSKGTA